MNLKANFITALVLVAPLATAGCKAKTNSAEPADASARRALLERLGRDVIASSYADFAAKMATLEQSASGYAASLSADDYTGAQSAFREAVLSWERAEVYQVGPAARVSSQTPGGQGLRNEIQTWPSRNYCGVAAALLDQSYSDVKAFEAAQYADTRALESLEVLLFDTSEDPHCERTNVVDPSAWAALVASGDLPARRAAYAHTISTIVRGKADTLVTAFAAFLPELGTAGKGSKLFPTVQDGLNALTDAVFYVDTDTKDMKLGLPSGIAADCGDGCADLAELHFAKLSREAVVANLTAFRDLFFGTGVDVGAGELGSLADLLRSVSADRVADEIQTLTDKAIADAEAITPSLEEAAGGASTSLEKSYQSTQDLTTRLKTDFLSTLSLSLPMNAAADND